MKTYLAMASIHNDLLTTAVVKRPNDKNDPTRNTRIHAISCDSLKELLNLFLERYGDECSYLEGHMYLYVKIDGSWFRVTD